MRSPRSKGRPLGFIIEIGSTRNKRAILLAVGALLFLMGTVQTVNRIGTIRSPTVEAEAVQSRVVSIETGTSPVQYRPEVQFRYQVNGREYVARSQATLPGGNYTAAKRVVDSYVPGSRHVVHYISRNPTQIYANAGYTLGFLWEPATLLFLGLLSLAATLYFFPFTGSEEAREKQDSNSTSRWVGWLFASIGLISLLIGGWIAHSQSKASKIQPALVRAQVASSHFHHYVKTYRDQNSQGNQTRDEDIEELIVEFQYSVEGNSFVSPTAEDIGNAKGETRRQHMNAMLAQYSPGSWHQISYDPHDPNDIRIHDWRDRPNPHVIVFVFLGLGTVFLAVGILAMRSRSKPIETAAVHASHRARLRVRL
jgi:uncharacterized protein DUF3592